MKTIIKNACNRIYDLKRRRYLTKKFSNLDNKDFTIFSCNCTGGVLYHDLNMKFLSPTINMYMVCEDFIKFCENPKHYLSLEMEEYKGDIVRDYPIATLGDITLFLVHYESIGEAAKKWNRRKARINWDNIFVIGTDRDGFNEELSNRFDLLPYKKVLFTHLPDDNPNHFYIKGFEDETQVGTVVEKTSRLSGKRVYDRFDWVTFFND